VRVWACVCVCVRETESKREREREREKERSTEENSAYHIEEKVTSTFTRFLCRQMKIVTMTSKSNYPN